MKITAIKQQVRNPNRVSLFVDGTYSVSLTLDQLLEEKIKKADEVEESDIKRLKKLSDEGKQKQRVMEWLMMRPHSTRELRDYMYRKKIDKDCSEAWIEEFTNKKYVNDEHFARWFAEQRSRKNKSTRAISAELASKGISRNVASVVIAELEADDDDALVALIKKLEKRPRYQDRQKFTAYLISKGFRYADVKKALEDRA